MTEPIMTARDVSLTRAGRPILRAVDLDIVPGELLALVGPNGAGKSTLLAVLSGDLAPDAGRVALDGRSIGGYSHDELARARAVLTQENTVSFPFRVSEVVAMGRAPWARRIESRDDIDAVSAALAATDVVDLRDRRFTELSGGEKARVSLARVLAQRTRVVLLDEPTASLDLRHQEDVMRTARALAADGRAVVVVVHDLSLAGAYADRIALLADGAIDAIGAPNEVLEAERLSRVYALEVSVELAHGRPVVIPLRA